jgi:hypothetical protein
MERGFEYLVVRLYVELMMLVVRECRTPVTGSSMNFVLASGRIVSSTIGVTLHERGHTSSVVNT